MRYAVVPGRRDLRQKADEGMAEARVALLSRRQELAEAVRVALSFAGLELSTVAEADALDGELAGDDPVRAVFVDLASGADPEAVVEQVRSVPVGADVAVFFFGSGPGGALSSTEGALAVGGDAYFALPAEAARVLARLATYLDLVLPRIPASLELGPGAGEPLEGEESPDEGGGFSSLAGLAPPLEEEPPRGFDRTGDDDGAPEITAEMDAGTLADLHREARALASGDDASADDAHRADDDDDDDDDANDIARRVQRLRARLGEGRRELIPEGPEGPEGAPLEPLGLAAPEGALDDDDVGLTPPPLEDPLTERLTDDDPRHALASVAEGRAADEYPPLEAMPALGPEDDDEKTVTGFLAPPPSFAEEDAAAQPAIAFADPLADGGGLRAVLGDSDEDFGELDAALAPPALHFPDAEVGPLFDELGLVGPPEGESPGEAPGEDDDAAAIAAAYAPFATAPDGPVEELSDPSEPSDEHAHADEDDGAAALAAFEQASRELEERLRLEAEARFARELAERVNLALEEAARAAEEERAHLEEQLRADAEARLRALREELEEQHQEAQRQLRQELEGRLQRDADDRVAALARELAEAEAGQRAEEERRQALEEERVQQAEEEEGLREELEARLRAEAERATEAERRAADADLRANHALSRAAEADERASEAEVQLRNAEERASEADFSAEIAQRAASEAISRAGTAEEGASEAISRAEAAEERASEAISRAEAAEERASEAESRAAAVESRAADAESRSAEAESRTAEARALAQDAESRSAEAESRTAEAESRAADAESRAAEARALAEDAESRAAAAESRVADAESRATEAESRATEAESRAAEAHALAEAATKRAEESDARAAEADARTSEAAQHRLVAEARAGELERLLAETVQQTAEAAREAEEATAIAWREREERLLSEAEVVAFEAAEAARREAEARVQAEAEVRERALEERLEATLAAAREAEGELSRALDEERAAREEAEAARAALAAELDQHQRRWAFRAGAALGADDDESVPASPQDPGPSALGVGRISWWGADTPGAPLGAVTFAPGGELEVEPPPPPESWIALAPLEGSFGEGDLPSLLWGAHVLEVTGALVLVDHSGLGRTLYLERGEPVGFGSELARDRPEEVLLRAGLVTAAKHAELRAGPLYSARRACAHLVDEGALKPQELFTAIRGVLIEQVLALLELPGGTFRYEREAAHAKDRVRLQHRFDALLAEGVRRKYDLPRLWRVLGGAQTLLGKDDRALRLPPLTPPERTALALLDGQRSLEDAVLDGALPAEDVLRAALLGVSAGAARVLARGVPGAPKEQRQDHERGLAIDKARIEDRLHVARHGDYFAFLGIAPESTSFEVRSAAEQVRRQFDPRRYSDPAFKVLQDALDEIRQVADEAEAVLADDSLRAGYVRNRRAAVS